MTWKMNFLNSDFSFSNESIASKFLASVSEDVSEGKMSHFID